MFGVVVLESSLWACVIDVKVTALLVVDADELVAERVAPEMRGWDVNGAGPTEPCPVSISRRCGGQM